MDVSGEVYEVVKYHSTDDPKISLVVFTPQNSVEYYCAEIKIRIGQYNCGIFSSTTTTEKKDYQKLGYKECRRYENISLPIPRLWTDKNLNFNENTHNFGVLQ
jgi:hypothetical protein